MFTGLQGRGWTRWIGINLFMEKVFCAVLRACSVRYDKSGILNLIFGEGAILPGIQCGE